MRTSWKPVTEQALGNLVAAIVIASAGVTFGAFRNDQRNTALLFALGVAAAVAVVLSVAVWVLKRPSSVSPKHSVPRFGRASRFTTSVVAAAAIILFILGVTRSRLPPQAADEISRKPGRASSEQPPEVGEPCGPVYLDEVEQQTTVYMHCLDGDDRLRLARPVSLAAVLVRESIRIQEYEFRRDKISEPVVRFRESLLRVAVRADPLFKPSYSELAITLGIQFDERAPFDAKYQMLRANNTRPTRDSELASWRSIGFIAEPITDSNQPRDAVRVAWIDRQSVAAAAGIRVGDTLTNLRAARVVPCGAHVSCLQVDRTDVQSSEMSTTVIELPGTAPAVSSVLIDALR